MPYVGQKPADIISTAVDTVTGKFSGEVDAASLDISGNIDVDGTTNLDVVDIDGAVDMASTLAVGGNTSIGTGAASTYVGLVVNGGTDANLGPTIYLNKGGTSFGVLSNYGRIQGGTSSDFFITTTTTNNLIFGTNNAERMRIDATGAITMPLQPAFHAHKNDTAQSNFATDGANVVFSAERFDNNADFDLSNNRFVAPVTGKYFLNISMRLDSIDIDAGYYQLSIITSNVNYHFIITPKFSADLQYFGMSHSVVADMDAGDTASIIIEQNGGAAQTDIPGSDNYTHFSGYLVA